MATFAPATASVCKLQPRHIPDDSWYDPVIGAHMATGEAAHDMLAAEFRPGATTALDIETPGLTDPFSIKAVTAAWQGSDGTYRGILLDPLRRERDHAAVTAIVEHSATLVFHNMVFDAPGLYWSRLMPLEAIERSWDTLTLARMANSNEIFSRSLESLAPLMLGWPDNRDGIAQACRALGGRGSDAEWYFRADAHMPAYRFGAMFDTLATVKLFPLLYEAAVTRLLDAPGYDRHRLQTRTEADAEVRKQQRVNQIVLRRNVLGFNWNPEYLGQYRTTVDADVDAAAAELEAHNVRPGNGDDLMAALEKLHAVPHGYPRTEKTRKLSTTKKDLERLRHPLVDQHRAWKDATKVIGYLEDVTARAMFTGRIHPTVNILGAVATGRMSASNPAYQQFPEKARPIFVDDGEGWSSVDWSQIEPVTLGVMAGDWDFLADFWLPPHGRGADLYEPIMRAAAIDRKLAKTLFLADIYGQGLDSLAAALNTTPEAVDQLKTQMHSVMPVAARFMGSVIAAANETCLAITAAGRVLHVPAVVKNGYRKVMAYKAVNYGPGQGSAYDVLADSIIRIDKAGLSDALRLYMHDEVVVATEAAPDIEAIMQTPPEFFQRWTNGRFVPPLRTDRKDLGHHWDVA